MLTQEQKKEIAAVVALALSLFLLLALVPTAWFGERGADWFPSGNLIGQAGGFVRAVLVAAIGVVGAGCTPVLVLLGGLRLGGWIEKAPAIRGGLLTSGLAVLLPILTAVLMPEAEAAGWLGGTLAGVFLAALGTLGSTLAILVLLLVLFVATLSVNPVRAATGGAVRAGGGLAAGLRMVGSGFRGAASWVGDAFRANQERRRVRITTPPVDPEMDADFDDPSALDDFDAVPDPPAPKAPRKERASKSSAFDAPDIGPIAGIPPIDLLVESSFAERRSMEHELDRLGGVLVEKLRSFRVESELGGRTTGPVVTQFEVVPAAGVKVNTIANLEADLALAMKAESIRIVAPIPGKGAVGVEIPNPRAEVVRLREILESPAHGKGKLSLPLGLGKDLSGAPYVADLAKMPHMLIAGATGSGKSVCLNTIITSLVYRHTPQTLRLVMIDPKMVELSAYADLPHLRHPVVTDPQEAAGALKWAVLEMDRRYRLLSANGVRSISEFNARVEKVVPLRRAEAVGDEGDPDRWIYDDGPLPYVVVVVDELADLILTVQAEVERPLAMLAQKARAIGIHLIVATQRPSVNVITGVIKANFPCRIAFRVASKTDSRTILDQNGADTLLGNGDMLFLPPGKSDPVRIQGAFISTEETDRLVSWYLEEAESLPSFATERDILDEVRAREQEQIEETLDGGSEDWDEYFKAAAEICIRNDQGSTSLLQRKLRVGYGRAARIVDQLESAGVLGPPDGSKPRDVLIGLPGLDLVMSGGTGRDRKDGGSFSGTGGGDGV